MKVTRLRTIVSIVVTLGLLGVASLAFSGGSTTGTTEEKTLTVGIIAGLASPLGLDMYHAIQVRAGMDNDAGGLLIGDERYKVELIVYDTKMDQATVVSAVNKLVFQDKVKYVLGDLDFGDVIVPITDPNKVVFVGGSTTSEIFKPKYHYAFEGAGANTAVPVSHYGFLYKYLGGGKKTIMFVAGDTASTYSQVALWRRGAESGGFECIEEMYVPVTTQDYSPVGLKVAQLNPDVCSMAIGPAQDALLIKAAKEFGYQGVMNCPAQLTVGIIRLFAEPEDIEGYMGGAWPTEFNPPTTELGKEFKDAWIAMFGKWESPEIKNATGYEVLRAALMKCGSTDPEIVADTIGSGLEYEGPQGKGRMVPRLDLGNPRTVDNVLAFNTKIVKDGEPVLVDHLTVDQAEELFNAAYNK